MSQRVQYINQPLVPNGNGCHVIQIPSGNLSVEDLLSHVDFQLHTSFQCLHQMEVEESYDEGKAAALHEMAQPVSADYEHDHDALDRIRTAEATGWIPPCLKEPSK